MCAGIAVRPGAVVWNSPDAKCASSTPRGTRRPVRTRKLAAVELRHHRALVEHVGALRNGLHEIDILFDDQHGQPLLAIQGADEAAELLHDARLHPVAGLVQQQQVRLVDERARDGEHRLLAAAQGPPPLREPLAEKGEVPEHRLEIERTPALVDEPSHAQIVAHRHVGKDAAPLGHVTDPEAGAPERAQTRYVASLVLDAAAARGQQADQRLHEGRLADPVSPQHAHHLARLDREPESLQHIPDGVPGAKTGGGEHHHATSVSLMPARDRCAAHRRAPLSRRWSLRRRHCPGGAR